MVDKMNQLFSVCCYIAAFRITGGFRFASSTSRHVQAVTPATCQANTAGSKENHHNVLRSNLLPVVIMKERIHVKCQCIVAYLVCGSVR